MILCIFSKTSEKIWITKKTQTLSFHHNGETKQTRWSDLQQLHAHEDTQLLKLSSLTWTSVNPTSIEKQKVSLALNFFSEKTSAALKTTEARTRVKTLAKTFQKHFNGHAKASSTYASIFYKQQNHTVTNMSLLVFFFTSGRHRTTFRKAAGCNYYIMVADVARTHAIGKAKLLLQHGVESDKSIRQKLISFLPINDAREVKFWSNLARHARKMYLR
ncbi:hypothetical protein ElyMa_002445100 [Elysia marginata]|uniref:Uncharacterized protein n=1 Tax=Elysia marginata TaxID=1093978 RepID=A0AAV4GMF5_9GAST|nr:hypothetical protein ElyMa_002445100 [Elysia marginata]